MNAERITALARRLFPGLLRHAVPLHEYSNWEMSYTIVTNINDDFQLPQVQECIRLHAHTFGGDSVYTFRWTTPCDSSPSSGS